VQERKGAMHLQHELRWQLVRVMPIQALYSYLPGMQFRVTFLVVRGLLAALPLVLLLEAQVIM